MMKGYRLAWVFVLFCLLMVVAGCTAVPTATAPAENVDVLTDQETEAGWAGVDPSGQSLTFWHQHRGDRAEALDALVAEFNATNEYGITMEALHQGDYSQIFSKMLTLLGTPDVPSLVIAYQYQAASYQLADGLVDLNSLVNDPVWGLSEEEQADFFPGFYASDVFPNFDGARLGFPPNRSIEVMYYNIDWLAELGYESPPTTPEEFLEMACRAVDEPFSGGVSDESSLGLQWGHSPASLAALTFSFGGDIFDYETGQFTYDDPAAVAALEFIRSVYDAGCAGDVVERGGHYAAFGRGKLLFFFSTTSGMPFAASNVDGGAGFNWGIAAPPRRVDDPVTNLYGASISIPRSTPEQELATWIFVKYFTSPEAQAKWARASNYFPVRQSVATGLDDYFEENPNFETAFSLLPYGKAEPSVPGFEFVRDMAREAMVAIMDGADATATLAELNAEANAFLAEQLEEQ